MEWLRKIFGAVIICTCAIFAFLLTWGVLMQIPFVLLWDEAVLSTISVVLLQLVVRVVQAWAKVPYTNPGLKVSKRALLEFLAGVSIVILAVSAAFLIERAVGKVAIKEIVLDWNKIGAELFKFFLTAWKEELVFRGFILQFFATPLEFIPAALVDSSFFAYLHGISLEQFPSYLVGGLWLAYAYYRTGNLWLPIGLHLAWDFIPGPVFGYTDQVSYSIIHQIRSTPSSWLGFFGGTVPVYFYITMLLTVIVLEFFCRIGLVRGNLTKAEQ